MNRSDVAQPTGCVAREAPAPTSLSDSTSQPPRADATIDSTPPLASTLAGTCTLIGVALTVSVDQELPCPAKQRLFPDVAERSLT